MTGDTWSAASTPSNRQGPLERFPDCDASALDNDFRGQESH